jgi:hypothetical protein
LERPSSGASLAARRRTISDCKNTFHKTAMSSESQLIVPPSFLALYLRQPGNKLTAPREHVLQRYELCEDMAQMLVDTTRDKLFSLGVDEQSVLQRTYDGLQDSDALVLDEPLWVVRRLAELQAWELPSELAWSDEEKLKTRVDRPSA